ncbi:lamin tail domain-containing protein [Nonlabens xiamenensis]|uniref:lamin tail domain-containing protein n=1 Tax=Nonlabens xiamenensis TaxID=2341043 RepID=UPI000F611471|nr:lamin tail domain-containing protein [Nonlabens xiamenensis]
MRELILLLFLGYIASGQVGLNTLSPDPATVLDINAQTNSGTYGGMTIPTLTESDKNHLAVSPASEGVLLWVQYPDQRCLEIYDGQQSLWQKINCLQIPTKLLISEYVEADQSNKFIELYNPTSNPIDLSSYKILIFRNGGDFPIGGTDREIFLSGTVAPMSTFVLANSLQTLLVGPLDLVLNGLNFDFGGDDPVLLVDLSNNIIDVIGIPGIDPGNGYAVDGVITENATIRRNASIQTPNPAWNPLEWTAFPNNDVSGLGSR